MSYQALTERVGVYGGGVNIGIIRTAGSDAILVDTGANESNARKMLRCVREELQLDVVAVLTTHAHADHFGGHEFVVKRTNATVYASPIEATIVEHPELQPSFLFGGAAPPAALRERFILARSVPVGRVVEGDEVHIEDVAVQVVPLPGHSPNQVGYLVDGVFLCADVVFPATAIEKYRIPYLFDLGRHLASMDHAVGVPCDVAVPGHGPVERNLTGLVELNRAIVEETRDAIFDQLDAPRSAEAIAASVFEAMDVPMSGHVSYYLLRPTIAAYLTWLESTGHVEHVHVGKQSLWRRT